jgi:uncharacterized membrane protein YjjP (DUF1212 family)
MTDDPRLEFLNTMAEALAEYGETSDGIQDGLSRAAAALDVEASFWAVPRAVFASYGHGNAVRTVLLPTADPAMDLQALSLLDQTLRSVIQGRNTAAQGLAEVRLITVNPIAFPWYMRVLSGGLGAASVTLLLGGGWREMVAAVPVGLAVGALILLARNVQALSRLVELLAGLLAAALALSLAHWLPPFHVPSVVLAGIIMLLPGLAITRGVEELADHHLVSGSARLAGAVVTLVNLSFGVAMGYALLATLRFMPHSVTASPGSAVLFTAIAIVGMTLALTISTNSRTSDVLVVLAAVTLAVLGGRLGSALVGPTLGVAFAAILVGLGSNLYARLTKRSAAIPQVPGLAVLVPGALGYRGTSTLLHSTTGSIQLLGAVFVIAAGLVVGLLIADATLPARPG